MADPWWVHARKVKVNGQVLTRRKCLTWHQCDKCGGDIKYLINKGVYWETPGKYRLCPECMAAHVNEAGFVALVQ